jgi:hypothetical protein
MIWLLPHSPPPLSKLDRWHAERLRKRVNLLAERGGGGGEGAKLYDIEKAWSSITQHIKYSQASVTLEQNT